MRDEEAKRHPSYGNIVIHRTGGHIGRLHGSPLKDHTHAMRITISTASFKHDLGSDWHHAEDELIEVSLSPAQYADLITSPNIGGGVPCTINFVRGQPRIESPPEDEPVEHERVVDAFKQQTAETAERLREAQKKLRVLLAKKTLSKDDKEKIDWIVGKALQDVEANAPFMIRMFGEAAEKVVTAFNAEMAASVQSTVERLGFEKLEDMKRVLEAAPAPVKEIE
jgi:hypothetical protein